MTWGWGFVAFIFFMFVLLFFSDFKMAVISKKANFAFLKLFGIEPFVDYGLGYFGKPFSKEEIFSILMINGYLLKRDGCLVKLKNWFRFRNYLNSWYTIEHPFLYYFEKTINEKEGVQYFLRKGILLDPLLD